MNASEARRQRREEERAERRRSERLAEKMERDAEEEREAERAEERRRQVAREEAEARAAEERARERRLQRLASLRRERTTAARRAQAREEHRQAARSDRAEGERVEAERAARSEQRRERQVQDQRAAERQAEAEQAAGEERRGRRTAEEEAAARSEETRRTREEERRARAREEEQAAQRAAELRAADAERRVEDRRASEAEAQRREQALEEQRRKLLDERRRRAREAEARAERLRRAREAKVRELAQVRAASEAERERAGERRAREARRREAERRAQAERESRQRERRAPRVPEQAVTELPWLRTEDGRVVEWGGAARVLRGVNVVGLDEAAAGDTSLREALALDDRNLEELTDRWGASVVRVPFSAGTILGSSKVLDRLDELVDALAGSSVYTLLALKPSPGLPDQGTHDAWALLADRFQGQPGTLFEPYAAEAPLGEDWPEAALELIHTIRSIHQSSLLLLPGADLDGLPLPVPNLVYTLRDTSGSRPRLDERFAAFARRNPMLVSEWANEGPDFGRSAMANAGLFERLDIGWCACNWNAPPRLVADSRSHRFAETRFGLIVRRALAAPVRPALSPY